MLAAFVGCLQMTNCSSDAPIKHLSPLKESLATDGAALSPHGAPPTPSPVFASPLSKDEIRQLLLKEANYDCDCASKTPKRSTYLSWDDYFMSIAYLSARRSKDPTTPTGACIVDADNRVIGIGYNGFPRGCSDDLLPWKFEANSPFLHTPSPYECHAEVNAILNKCSSDVAGARMYVAQFPCKHRLS